MTFNRVCVCVCVWVCVCVYNSKLIMEWESRTTFNIQYTQGKYKQDMRILIENETLSCSFVCVFCMCILLVQKNITFIMTYKHSYT